MNYEDWQKIKDIFNEAVELDDFSRERLLQNAADLSPKLLGEVRKLLKAEAEHQFEPPLINFAALWEQDEINSLIGEKVGGYEIIGEIGRGGIGVVYHAKREMPDFVQTVALKLLKRELHSDLMLNRFRYERRILASLEHPHIARLLDGGITGEGISYLAMEYIDGVPLDAYCRENDLSIRERLKIFLQICSAVAFAHSRLVVHRDLKPSNILVTPVSIVKLLDFGIAKMISPADGSLAQTVTEYRMMTPAYASPEQIRGELVSTPSDIYSLGLILYELLTDTPAYNFASNRADDVARVICEREPARPSAVASGKKPALPSESKTTESPQPSATGDKNNETDGSMSSSRRARFLKGDLDNITLKALRKDPARRYASVEQFANDIRRHLDGLPVTARPDTFGYRLEKFVARNRVKVFAAALVIISLVAGLGASVWQARRAERERQLAEKRFDQVRELANNSVFKYYDQIKDLQGATTARETLLKDATLYLDRLAADAENNLTLEKDLVNAYFRLGDILGAPRENANTGDTQAARENYQKAQIAAENLLRQTPDDWEVTGKLRAVHTKLGEIYQRMGKAAETKEHFRAAVELSHKIADHELESPKQLSALGQSYILYGETLPLGMGENESVTVSSKGFPYLEKALEIAPDDPPSLQRLNMAHVRVGLQIYALARDAEEGGDRQKSSQYFERAADYFHRSIAEAQKLIALDAANASFRRRLFAGQFNESTSLSGLGQTDEALRVQKNVLTQTTAAASDAANAEAQFDLAQTYYELGATFFRRGEYKQAASNIEIAIDLYSRIAVADPGNVEAQKNRFEARIKFGTVKLAEKNYSEAGFAFDKAFSELRESTAGQNSDYLRFAEGWVNEKLGDTALAAGDLVITRRYYAQALSLWEESSAAPIRHGFSQTKIDYLREKASHTN